MPAASNPRPPQTSTRPRNSAVLTLTVMAGIIAVAVAGWQLLLFAPSIWQVNSIQVDAGDGPTILGHRELGQRPHRPGAAERDQLQLDYRDERWWVTDIGRGEAIDAPSTLQHSRLLRRWRLAPGDTIRVGEQTLTVASVDNRQLTLNTADGQQAQWRDGRLDTGNTPFTGCPSEGSDWWKHHLSAVLVPLFGVDEDRELRLFSIGGQVDCPRRWALPAPKALPLDSLRVNWSLGSFQIAAGNADVSITVAGRGDQQPHRLDQLALPIGDAEHEVKRIRVGQQWYQLSSDADHLRITPEGGGDSWNERQTRPTPRPPNVRVDYRLSRWIGAGDTPRGWLQRHPWWLALAVLLSGVALLRLSSAHHRIVALGSSLLPASVFGLVLMLGLWLQPAIDLRWLFWIGWLGWGWSSAIVLETRRLRGSGGGLWLLTLLISAIGTLTIGQLAAGGNAGPWADIVAAHWGLWGVAGWALGLVALTPANRARWLLVALFSSRNGQWRTLRSITLLLLVGLLLLQVALSYRQGLAGMQPVEAIRLSLVLLLAFLGIALERRRHGETSRTTLLTHGSWLLLLFGLLAATAGWSVADPSAILIPALLIISILWIIAPRADGQRSIPGLLLRLLLASTVLTLAALASHAWQSPEDLPHWLPWLNSLQVWAQPDNHPHSGASVLAAMAFSDRGGYWGTLPQWGGANGSIMQLAGVQREFIAAFLLFRFGAVAALVLLALQLLMLGLLFGLARHIADFWVGRDEPAGRGVALSLFGVAWLFAAQWLIGWSNAIGLLPVMAQPMSWIAADNAHLLLFAYPALTFALLAAWSNER